MQISRSLLVECIKYIYLYIVKNTDAQYLNTASKFLKVGVLSTPRMHGVCMCDHVFSQRLTLR